MINISKKGRELEVSYSDMKYLRKELGVGVIQRTMKIDMRERCGNNLSWVECAKIA